MSVNLQIFGLLDIDTTAKYIPKALNGVGCPVATVLGTGEEVLSVTLPIPPADPAAPDPAPPNLLLESLDIVALAPPASDRVLATELA